MFVLTRTRWGVPFPGWGLDSVKAERAERHGTFTALCSLAVNRM